MEPKIGFWKKTNAQFTPSDSLKLGLMYGAVLAIGNYVGHAVAHKVAMKLEARRLQEDIDVFMQHHD